MAHQTTDKLLEAIKKEEILVVKELIEDGMDCHSFGQANGGEKLTYLHFAVKNGQIDIVKYLAEEQNVDVNQSDSKGIPPLNDAASRDDLELLKLLIKNGADCNAVSHDMYGDSACHRAAINGRAEIIKYLVQEKSCDINKRNNQGRTPLHGAAILGDVEFFKLLLDLGADYKAVDDEGLSALWYAKLYNRNNISEFLIECKNLDRNNLSDADDPGENALHVLLQLPLNKNIFEKENGVAGSDYEAYVDDYTTLIEQFLNDCKFDVNKSNEKGFSPLHLACARSELKIVKLLVDRGANCLALDSNRRSVLHAVAAGKEEIARYLIDEKQLDVNKRDQEGLTPFHVACAYGNVGIVKLLIEKGAEVNLVDDSGDTGLHIAWGVDRTDVIKYLLNEEKLDVKQYNRYGISPLRIACELCDVDTVKRLINNRSVDCTEADDDGCTALNFAAFVGNADVVRYLIDEKGLDVNKRTLKTRATVLIDACVFGDLDTVKILVERGADLKAVDVGGNSCLHYAVGHIGESHPTVVKYLIKEKNADYRQRNLYGVSPIQMMTSRVWEFPDILRLI